MNLVKPSYISRLFPPKFLTFPWKVCSFTFYPPFITASPELDPHSCLHGSPDIEFDPCVPDFRSECFTVNRLSQLDCRFQVSMSSTTLHSLWQKGEGLTAR